MGRLYRITTNDEIVSRPGTGAMHVGVTIHWFRDGRLEPALPYVDTIPAWDEMRGSGDLPEHHATYLWRLEAYVDQLFTQDEADAVCACLAQHRATDILVEEVQIPITDFDIPYRNIPEESPARDGYGFLELSEAVGRGLPFRVSGFFDAVYDTLHKRQQVATLGALVESAGRDIASDGLDETVQAINDKMVLLRVALLELQRALNKLTVRLERESHDQA